MIQKMKNTLSRLKNGLKAGSVSVTAVSIKISLIKSTGSNPEIF